MTFLVRFTLTVAGEVEHDETVLATVDALTSLHKPVTILGQRGELRVEFDPPLAPIEAAE